MRARAHGVVAVVALSTALTIGGWPALARPTPPYAIRLPSRTFTPEPGMEEALADRLVQSRRIYGMLQLWRPVSPAEFSDLEQRRIRLHQFLGGTSYIAAFGPETTPEAVRELLGEIVRWAGVYRPDDKQERAVLDRDFAEPARLPDGRATLIVRFHDDVSREEAERVLGSRRIAFAWLRGSREWAIALEPEAIDGLAAEEPVLAIRRGSRAQFESLKPRPVPE